MELLKWLVGNYIPLLEILGGVVAVGEMITRLTPTQTDDGFVHRIGEKVDKLLDLLKIPKITKKI